MRSTPPILALAFGVGVIVLIASRRNGGGASQDNTAPTPATPKPAPTPTPTPTPSPPKPTPTRPTAKVLDRGVFHERAWEALESPWVKGKFTIREAIDLVAGDVVWRYLYPSVPTIADAQSTYADVVEAWLDADAASRPQAMIEINNRLRRPYDNPEAKPYRCKDCPPSPLQYPEGYDPDLNVRDAMESLGYANVDKLLVFHSDWNAVAAVCEKLQPPQWASAWWSYLRGKLADDEYGAATRSALEIARGVQAASGNSWLWLVAQARAGKLQAELLSRGFTKK